MSVLPSYRNQSIDLHSKSIDWFLYEGNTGIHGLTQIIAMTPEIYVTTIPCGTSR